MAVRTGAVVLVLLVTAMAGCTEMGGRSVDIVRAPIWDPGYFWSFAQTTTEGLEDGRSASSATQRSQLLVQVMNTTEPYGGQAAYYVRHTEKGYGHDKASVQYEALSATDLRPLARGYDAPKVPYGRCAGKEPTLAWPADEEDPEWFRFPLEAGAQWTTTAAWGTSSTTVHGPSKVTVPIGTFQAFRIETDVAVFFDDDFAFEGKIQYWYSPEAKYFVKQEIRAHGRSLDPDVPLEYTLRSSMELENYGLTRSPGEPAPKPWDPDRYRLAPQSFHIAADKQLRDENAAEGPVEVTFGLLEKRHASKQVHWVDARGMSTTPVVEPEEMFVFDPERFGVRWRVVDLLGQATHDATGDQAAFTFQDGGAWRVTAEVYPAGCEEVTILSAWEHVALPWSKTWTLDVPPGLPTVHKVDDFPVAMSPRGTGLATWSYGASTLPPNGLPRVTDPDGAPIGIGSAGNNQATFQPWREGTYTLSWDARGSGSGPVAVPLTDGYRLTISLTIDYGW